MGAEVDEQGGSLFDTGDRAKTVLVVGDLVIYREALGSRLRIGRAERTGGQVTPGRGGVKGSSSPVCACLRRGPQGVFCVARFRGRTRTRGGCVSSRFRARRLASGVKVAQYLRTGEASRPVSTYGMPRWAQNARTGAWA